MVSSVLIYLVPNMIHDVVLYHIWDNPCILKKHVCRTLENPDIHKPKTTVGELADASSLNRWHSG